MLIVHNLKDGLNMHNNSQIHLPIKAFCFLPFRHVFVVDDYGAINMSLTWRAGPTMQDPACHLKSSLKII